MNNLQKLIRKKNKLVVGLMSGTSADAIDAVLLRVGGNGVKTRYKQVSFTKVPYPKGFKQFILRNSHVDTARLDDVARLNILVGGYFAEAAQKVVRRAGMKISDIDLIGSHGQTIGHYPAIPRTRGRNVSSTLQIGDPSVIAKRTGVVTVGDFRIADVAVGGSGAPLVPYIDYLLFRSKRMNRGLLNIGGIANITVLPRKCSIQDVVAFDTGPGNMLIDTLMWQMYGTKLDEAGRVARSGVIIPSLLRWLVHHPYLRKRPPKSTGREMFGGQFVDQILRRAKGVKRQDIIATASAFTTLAVYDGYVRFIRRWVKMDELFVSGGGAQNIHMMDLLRRLFDGVRIETVESLGISAEAKEAICFALLANEAIAGNPANVPGATGAKRGTVLGKICV